MGINNRYIGKIAMLAKSREDLYHLHFVGRHLFIGSNGEKIEKGLVPGNRSLFLDSNLSEHLRLLFNGTTDTEEIVSDEVAATKKSKIKKGGGSGGGGASGPVTKTTSAGKGVQITLKDYKFSLTASFNEGDLACIVPVVKHTDFTPLEAFGLYELAQVQLQSSEVPLDYLSEAVQLFAKAISYQHKTVIMYERLLGVDHSSSISAYFPTKHANSIWLSIAVGLRGLLWR
uniref:Uncharacterized protein n=1 Tax=Amphimedon queenslandica TaxID=400682 RepID=A0A1X7TV68_AMPQE